MDAVSEWIERGLVVDVLYRYATAIDDRDWSMLRSCFVEDCRLDYGEIGEWSSADQVVEFMREAHKDLSHTLHRITNPVVEIRDATAAARSYVHAILVHPGAPGHPIQAFGHYDDELEKSDQGWRIVRRRFSQAFVDTPSWSADLP